MLDTARFNGKTVWCLKNDSDIWSTSSYDIDWNLAKAFTFPHVEWQSLNGVASGVQFKIKIFLEIALLVDEPISKVERRFTGTEKRGRCQSHMANCHTTTERNNAPKSTEKCQSFGISICRTHSMQVCDGAYHEILFHISYSLCLPFLLSSSIIVFYNSSEVIKIAFLENKSRYVWSIFDNFMFTFETKS